MKLFESAIITVNGVKCTSVKDNGKIKLLSLSGVEISAPDIIKNSLENIGKEDKGDSNGMAYTQICRKEEY